VPSKTKVLNDQLEKLQHSAEGALLPAHLTGQGHVMARQGERQTGRRRKYSNAVIQFCLTKRLFNLGLRQAMGMAQSLLKLAGLDWQVPDFSTVSRREKHLSVTIAAQPTTMALHLLVDSTVIKTRGEGE
jgi:hypothetical protein